MLLLSSLLLYFFVPIYSLSVTSIQILSLYTPLLSPDLSYDGFTLFSTYVTKEQVVTHIYVSEVAVLTEQSGALTTTPLRPDHRLIAATEGLLLTCSATECANNTDTWPHNLGDLVFTWQLCRAGGDYALLAPVCAPTNPGSATHLVNLRSGDVQVVQAVHEVLAVTGAHALLNVQNNSVREFLCVAVVPVEQLLLPDFSVNCSLMPLHRKDVALPALYVDDSRTVMFFAKGKYMFIYHVTEEFWHCDLLGTTTLLDMQSVVSYNSTSIRLLASTPTKEVGFVDIITNTTTRKEWRVFDFCLIAFVALAALIVIFTIIGAIISFKMRIRYEKQMILDEQRTEALRCSAFTSYGTRSEYSRYLHSTRSSGRLGIL